MKIQFGEKPKKCYLILRYLCNFAVQKVIKLICPISLRFSTIFIYFMHFCSFWPGEFLENCKRPLAEIYIKVIFDFLLHRGFKDIIDLKPTSIVGFR